MTESLQDVLDLEQIELGMFRGRVGPSDLPRVFGGEVAGQALVAAGRTVDPGRRVHSLHAYFLRPGDPRTAILYTVDEIRDGRSFTTRRVVATQHGEPIFNLAASFQVPEPGVEHQVPQMPVTDPEELPSAEEAMASADPPTRERIEHLRTRFPVEVRFDGQAPLVDAGGRPGPPRQRLWMRAAAPLTDDPLVHVCAVTYASDLFLLAAALPPHPDLQNGERAQMASLDHAMWFHAAFRADEWLFYDQEGTWAGGGRALCRGSLFDRRGVLVASVVQEGLVRRLREAAPAPG